MDVHTHRALTAISQGAVKPPRPTALIEIKTLGSLRLEASDGRNVGDVVRRSKRSALLAYLAASPRGMHRRDTLLALFWPETDATRARAALNQAVYVLRKELGDDAITARGDDEVGLNADVVRVDLWAFEDAIGRNDPARALALYDGDLLAGFFLADAPEFERWLDQERTRLRARAAEAAWALAQAQAAKDEGVDAARWARRSAELSPPDEALARRLIAFLEALGDRSAAVIAYEEYVRRLKQELDLEPSREMQQWLLEVRASNNAARPLRAITSAPRAPARDPYPDVDPVPRTQSRTLVTVALVLLALLVPLGFKLTRAATYGSDAQRAPKILVLPFKHAGDSATAFYAEAISDEIMSRLAMVPGVRVIGRQTSSHYSGVKKPSRDIGREIGAEYILEGSVTSERTGNGARRLRIRPQLTRVSDDTQLWADILDAHIDQLPDLFALLSRIANRVTQDLRAAVREGALDGPVPPPTRDLVAYDDYVRARQILYGTWASTNRLAAIRLLTHAVKRDTTFALAYAWLSFAHTDAFWMNARPPAHLDSARRAGERALRLDSLLADAHMAMGNYYYVCCQDYPRAIAHLEVAHRRRPGDAQVVMFMGNVHKRSGNWTEAAAYYEQASQLDPRWRSPLLNLGQMRIWERRYDDAERTLQLALELDPQEAFAYSYRTWIPILRNGDLAAARRVLSDAALLSDAFEGIRTPFHIELLARDYRKAASLARSGQPAGEVVDDWLGTNHIRRGVAARLLDEHAVARVQFDSARVEFEEILRNTSAEARIVKNLTQSSLTVALAGLGMSAEASRMAAELLTADPVSVDAISGPIALQNVALAYVMLGQHDTALDILERLLTTPTRFSVSLLRLDPLWDPLRRHPRFLRLSSAH
jgi:DNA-binding SARP family transcriptional activator/TolB-like protein/Flp pilus assembly protein TadD